METITGLTEAQAVKRKKEGKINKLPQKTSKTTGQIIASNIFTYFNAIFFGLAVLVIITGSFRSLTFMVAVIANIIIGIVQQLRSKRILDKLALLDVSEYEVIREGKRKKLRSDELVLDDVIILRSGQQIPADAVVIDGEAGVNESLLTGESDEIDKKEGSTLKSGSFLVSGGLIARLTRVGSESYASKLTLKAKEVKERKSDMIRDIETIVKIAGILIIPVGGLLVYQALSINGKTFSEAILSMVSAVIGMIPEGLYLLVTIALVLSAARLAQRKVLLHDMKSIETLARVDVLCVDKTGTITDENMSVCGIFEGSDVSVFDQGKKDFSRYISTIDDSNITMDAVREYVEKGEKFVNPEIISFSSKTKYSQITTDDIVYRFGAPEFALSSDNLQKNKEIINFHASKGERVLVFCREIDLREDVLLFISLKNGIRENAPETFNTFRDQGVKIKVISGDNPVTVSRVAAEAGIDGADRYVDAAALDTKDKISDAVMKYTVFGRVQPEQKKDIIDAIKKNGEKVAMTGDGVNDILAMKEADCSIAMGSGSDAARQAAQVVLLDNDFSQMIRIVSEGRRTINNITRSATLFLYKNIFSLFLALFAIVTLISYPLRPSQVSMISMFNIGIPAFLLALEANEKKQEGEFIKITLLRSIPASLTSFLSVIAMMYFGKLFSVSERELATTCTYLLAIVGFLILWHITKPFNKYRTAVYSVCIGGFVLGTLFLKRIFDLDAISMKSVMICAVFALAQAAVLRLFLMGFDCLDKKVIPMLKQRMDVFRKNKEESQ